MRALKYRKQIRGIMRDSTPAASPNGRKGSELFRRKVENSSELAQTLASILEEIALATTVLEFAGSPSVEQGIDFYAEIRRYEIALIKNALKHAKGSQKKAAALLKLKQQTLHSKIKHYDIKAPEYRFSDGRLLVLR